MLTLLVCATPLSAQSTAFGKILYAPDRWWQSLLDHNPQMRTWDDTEEKSAAFTAGIVEVGGYALSKVSPLSFRHGRQIIAAIYVLRSVYGLSSGETTRYRAHAKHVLAATAVATLNVKLRIRF